MKAIGKQNMKLLQQRYCFCCVCFSLLLRISDRELWTDSRSWLRHPVRLSCCLNLQKSIFRPKLDLIKAESNVIWFFVYYVHTGRLWELSFWETYLRTAQILPAFSSHNSYLLYNQTTRWNYW